MKRMLISLLLLLGMLPLAASAADAYTTDQVNLRTGPDAGYPRVVTVPAGQSVRIYGCINDWSWCDASWRGERGWISGALLDYSYQGQRYDIYDYGPQLGLPILSFVFNTYWDSHYRQRPWYSERSRWGGHRPVYRPRPTQKPRPIQSSRPTSKPGTKPTGSTSRPGTKPASSTSRPGTKPTGSTSRPGTKPASSSSRPGTKSASSTSKPGTKPAGQTTKPAAQSSKKSAPAPKDKKDEDKD